MASGDVSHVAVPFGINSDENVHEEKSQRTRALLFLAFGAITALQARADTLHVFENGVGALNLPLNATQLGTDNYRGVHPRSLGMAEALFESILGESIHIENPYMFATKAEMCRSLPAAGLADVVRETVSCEGYPQRVPNQAQCGICTSCVLRRQSIFCAGLKDHDPGGAYRHDIFKGLSNLSAEEGHGFGVMSEQVSRIDGCLASDQPWQKLTVAYPELARTLAELTARPGAAAQEDLAAGFVGLFRTYVQEWKDFSSASRGRGIGGPMQENVVDGVDPRVLGQRLQDARRARGITQQEVADSLELARTTVTALEKGERRIRPDELISLAGLYGRPVSSFVGARAPSAEFSVQFRTSVNRASSPEAQQALRRGVQEFPGPVRRLPLVGDRHRRAFQAALPAPVQDSRPASGGCSRGRGFLGAQPSGPGGWARSEPAGGSRE